MQRASTKVMVEFYRVSILSADAWRSVCGDWNPAELADAKRQCVLARRNHRRWERRMEKEERTAVQALFDKLLPREESSAP